MSIVRCSETTQKLAQLKPDIEEVIAFQESSWDHVHFMSKTTSTAVTKRTVWCEGEDIWRIV